MRFYLDACCLNRPFDDQSQERIRMEAEAVLAIIQKVAAGYWTLLSSPALALELARTPDFQRRARTRQFLSMAPVHLAIDLPESGRVKHLQAAAGLGALDALHLASAESLRADVFLNTDDRLLRGTRRLPPAELSFDVANPLTWLTDFLAGG